MTEKDVLCDFAEWLLEAAGLDSTLAHFEFMGLVKEYLDRNKESCRYCGRRMEDPCDSPPPDICHQDDDP